MTDATTVPKFNRSGGRSFQDWTWVTLDTLIDKVHQLELKAAALEAKVAAQQMELEARIPKRGRPRTKPEKIA